MELAVTLYLAGLIGTAFCFRHLRRKAPHLRAAKYLGIFAVGLLVWPVCWVAVFAFIFLTSEGQEMVEAARREREQARRERVLECAFQANEKWPA